jgi:hypothetical protein
MESCPGKTVNEWRSKNERVNEGTNAGIGTFQRTQVYAYNLVNKRLPKDRTMSPLVVDDTGNDLTYRVIGAAMAVHNQLIRQDL